MKHTITSDEPCCVECGKPLSALRKADAKYCYDCLKKKKRERARDYASKHREHYREYLKDRYDWLKSKGFCVSCGHEKAAEGLVRCPSCADKNRKKKCRENHGTRKRKC